MKGYNPGYDFFVKEIVNIAIQTGEAIGSGDLNSMDDAIEGIEILSKFSCNKESPEIKAIIDKKGSGKVTASELRQAMLSISQCYIKAIEFD